MCDTEIPVSVKTSITAEGSQAFVHGDPERYHHGEHIQNSKTGPRSEAARGVPGDTWKTGLPPDRVVVLVTGRGLWSVSKGQEVDTFP